MLMKLLSRSCYYNLLNVLITPPAILFHVNIQFFFGQIAKAKKKMGFWESNKIFSLT